MNKHRREILRNAKGNLMAAGVLVSQALDEEEDCLGNLPDSLVDSERYEKMDHAVDALNEASDAIDSAIEAIDEALK